MNAYSIDEELITSTNTEKVWGLIVTLPQHGDANETIYWVTFSEVTPVHGGVPQPDKKWKRLSMLGISSSSWDGKSWSRKLTDEEFDALGQVVSTKDAPVLRMNYVCVRPIIWCERRHCTPSLSN